MRAATEVLRAGYPIVTLIFEKYSGIECITGISICSSHNTMAVCRGFSSRRLSVKAGRSLA